MATALAYIKKYWAILLLVLAAVAGAVLYKRENTSFTDQLQKIQDAHDVELKQIQAARDEEAKEHAANAKQLQDTLATVQKQYDAQQKDLDDKKKQEIQQLVKDYGDDPDALAQKLAEATGFNVILPS